MAGYHLSSPSLLTFGVCMSKSYSLGYSSLRISRYQESRKPIHSGNSQWRCRLIPLLHQPLKGISFLSSLGNRGLFCVI